MTNETSFSISHAWKKAPCTNVILLTKKKLYNVYRKTRVTNRDVVKLQMMTVGYRLTIRRLNWRLVRCMANENIDITSSFYFIVSRVVLRARPRGSNRYSGPRYNANKRRRNGRGEGAEEHAITCDQYTRVAFCRPRFSGWAIDFGRAVAFPSGGIDAILRALGVSSPASFTCALHARCIHRCIEGKRRERRWWRRRWRRETGLSGPLRLFLPFFSLSFFFLSEWKAPLASLCPSRSGGPCGL